MHFHWWCESILIYLNALYVQVLSTLCYRRKFPERFKDDLPHEVCNSIWIANLHQHIHIKQAALIELMLSEDPQKRPSAEEIASRVKTLKEDVGEDVTIPL